MNRQRLIIFLILAFVFIGATTLYFTQVWKESQTRFRAGLPIPRDIVPEVLLSDEERIPEGPPQVPNIRDNDPLISGSAKSPLTLIMVSDFQCDICRDQAQALKDALRLTGRSSDIRVVWRDFPIVAEHSKALAMAVVGRCAAAQGRFSEMYDLLYFETKEYTEEEFTRFARRINLDEQEFKVCIRDPAQTFYISEDVEDARMLAIKEVPTLFVDGFPIVGFVDTDSLATILRRELRRVSPIE
jgi:protein-disulfide isomerase